MKKYLTLAIILMLACVGLVYGCDKDKYKNLSYAVTYGNNQTITQDEGVSLIYGDSNKDNLTFNVVIEGVKGINKRVGITSDNKDVVLVKDITYQDDKTYATIQAIAPGNANITIVSLEYSKIAYKFPVKVRYPITAINTTYDENTHTLALTGNSTINLKNYLTLIPNTPYMTTDTELKYEVVSGGVNAQGNNYIDIQDGTIRVIDNVIPFEEKITVRVSSVNNPSVTKDIEIIAIKTENEDSSNFTIQKDNANVTGIIKLISHDPDYNTASITAIARSNQVYYNVTATSGDSKVCQAVPKSSTQSTVDGTNNSTIFNYDLVAGQTSGIADVKFSFVPYKYGYGDDAKIFVNSLDNGSKTIKVENINLAVGITTSVDGI